MLDSPIPWWALRFEALAGIDPGLVGAVDDDAEAEIDFLTLLADVQAGEQILDVACGAGRHAILLQERGHRVTGMDLSPRLLRQARESWDGRNEGAMGPSWMPGDMRWLPRSGPYDLALLLDHSFGVFEEETENLRTVSTLVELLKNPGRLVLSLNNPYYWAHRTLTRHFPKGSASLGADVVRSWRFDVVKGRLEERTVVFTEDERIEIPTLSVRAWTPAELTTLLRTAGFRKVQIFGSEGWDVPEDPMPPNAESVQLWVLAEV